MRIPPTKPCQSYHPGHSVHWIQGLHHANKPDVRAKDRYGHVVGIDGELVTVRFASGDERFRNHDTPRLRALTADQPVVVMVNDQYSLLMVGGYGVSIARDTGEPLGPCSPPDALGAVDAETLAERLNTDGSA